MKELKIGKVKQTFGNNSTNTFILKSLPSVSIGFWSSWVNLYKLDGSWSHIANIKTLENIN